MKFLRLGLKNFGPYKNEQWLDFPTDPDRGVMVVFGDNMRGKTSLLNALRWVLYGEALDRRSKAMAPTDLLNTEAAAEGDWEFWVSLQFEADGLHHELRRHASPTNAATRPRRASDLQIKQFLRKAGSFVPAEDIERQVNHLMPADVSRFYLFDGELLREYEELLVDDSEVGAAIKSAIEQVLGVPALVNGRDELRLLLKRAQAVQARDSRQVATLEAHARQSLKLQEEIETHDADLKRLRERLKETHEDLRAIDDELSAHTGVGAKQHRAADLQERRDQLLAEQKRLVESEHSVLQAAWRDLLQPRLQARIEELSKVAERHETQVRQLGSLQERVRQLQEVLERRQCPVCEAAVNDMRRSSLGALLGNLQAEIRAISVHEDAFATIGAELANLIRIKPVGAAERLREITNRRHAAALEVTRIDQELAEIADFLRNHDVARVAQLQAQRDGLVRLRGRLESEQDELERMLEDKNSKLRQLSRLMSRNPEGRKQRSSREVEIYSALEGIFASAIDFLRDRLRRRVEEEAAQVFSRLTTEPNYRGLRINQNYGLRIMDRAGADVPVRSAGAEQVVAMSLLAALNRTADRKAPVVIDTPFGRLDPKHRQRILEFVPDLAVQVVFLVHEGEIRKEGGLAPIAEHIGRIYEINRVSETHSILESA